MRAEPSQKCTRPRYQPDAEAPKPRASPAEVDLTTAVNWLDQIDARRSPQVTSTPASTAAHSRPRERETDTRDGGCSYVVFGDRSMRSSGFNGAQDKECGAGTQRAPGRPRRPGRAGEQRPRAPGLPEGHVAAGLGDGSRTGEGPRCPGRALLQHSWVDPRLGRSPGCRPGHPPRARGRVHVGGGPGADRVPPLPVGAGGHRAGRVGQPGGAADRCATPCGPGVLGPVLDGSDYAAIPDTDNGRWDGHRTWDRALGPLQLLPASWRVAGMDADGDGRRDPQNVYDAAGAAMVYLCDGGRDLGTRKGLEEAVLAYNHSRDYLRLVLAWKTVFDTADVTGLGSTPPLGAWAAQSILAPQPSKAADGSTSEPRPPPWAVPRRPGRLPPARGHRRCHPRHATHRDADRGRRRRGRPDHGSHGGADSQRPAGPVCEAGTEPDKPGDKPGDQPSPRQARRTSPATPPCRPARGTSRHRPTTRVPRPPAARPNRWKRPRRRLRPSADPSIDPELLSRAPRRRLHRRRHRLPSDGVVSRRARSSPSSTGRE